MFLSKELRPALSVAMIVTTLLVIVFFQMEERRRGYEILKTQRDHRRLMAEHRERNVELAKLTRPQMVESLAESRLTLKKASSGQIIHLSGLNQ